MVRGGREKMSTYSEMKAVTADILGVRIVRRANTKKAHAAVRNLILDNPSLSYVEIAALLQCSHWLVYTTAVEFGIRRPRGAGSPARRKTKPESKGE